MPNDYHSVPLDEEESVNGSTEKTPWLSGSRKTGSGPARPLQSHWIWLVHALLLSASVTLFTLSFCVKSANPSTHLLDHISTYSPLFPAVKYELNKFTLAPIPKGSPYAGYGPAVDDAWNVIANDIGDIMITEEERLKLGLSPDSLKIQDPRTGKWGYRAGVEVFHQLHCLNLLRQAIYSDYYGQKELGGDVGNADGPEDLFGHVDHCIEAIRENLMCQSDVSVFTFKTFPELADEGIEGEWPDFQINHMCRNFEAIRKWNNDHVVAWDHDV
ncbi:hypothetical protein B0T26DRAFT_674722 [Lasiosphaeria miniovina]|uniref:Cyclochlorotine biosynthesis protein O n=1 Tax=Lasiosphaeria miniovina TaxID=1954250 RepID=A0AA40E130_9PEZI|nr:uncharacterized protein B0T26DRAFT_674722 [Lasiosphaeria miniovina]KAK0723110.1 hypothetical protein B0T26DRAFT_674722 [Lasiosphaeria miniovina]